MALTLCLWILLTPYGYVYDLTGFSMAMAAMVVFSPGWRKAIFAVLWLMGGYTLTLSNLTGFVLMPLAALIGVVSIRQPGKAAIQALA
jgi:hypothetical protein